MEKAWQELQDLLQRALPLCKAAPCRSRESDPRSVDGAQGARAWHGARELAAGFGLVFGARRPRKKIWGGGFEREKPLDVDFSFCVFRGGGSFGLELVKHCAVEVDQLQDLLADDLRHNAYQQASTCSVLTGTCPRSRLGSAHFD